MMIFNDFHGRLPPNGNQCGGEVVSVKWMDEKWLEIKYPVTTIYFLFRYTYLPEDYTFEFDVMA